MTIASAFNDIAVAQGGTASKSGAITAAIDALNDALAGSDQPQAKTIEQAVRLLGEHIGGGSSVTVEALTATENKTYTAPEGKAYSPVTVNVSPTLGVLSAVEVRSGDSTIEGVSYETLIGEKRVAFSAGTTEMAIAGGADVVAYFEAESQPTVSATFGVGGNVQSFTDFEISYDAGENTVSLSFTMPDFDGEDWDAVLTFTCA